jgi:hypothetical protein
VNRSAEVELCFCRQGRALWAEDAPIDAGELSWLRFSIEVGRRGCAHGRHGGRKAGTGGVWLIMRRWLKWTL